MVYKEKNKLSSYYCTVLQTNLTQFSLQRTLARCETDNVCTTLEKEIYLMYLMTNWDIHTIQKSV